MTHAFSEEYPAAASAGRPIVKALFVSTCLLSIVSWYTTQQGMALYLNGWFAFLASLGVQSALILVAWLVAVVACLASLAVARTLAAAAALATGTGEASRYSGWNGNPVCNCRFDNRSNSDPIGYDGRQCCWNNHAGSYCSCYRGCYHGDGHTPPVPPEKRLTWSARLAGTIPICSMGNGWTWRR